MSYAYRISELERRKERLVAQCARERAELGTALAAWQAPLAALDRGIAATRFLAAHPVAVAAVGVVLAVLGRRRLLRWAGRGLLVWRTWRTVRALVGWLVDAASQPRPLPRGAARMAVIDRCTIPLRENRHG